MSLTHYLNDKSIDELSLSSDESSMSLFMERISDMNLDDASMSTKSCMSLALSDRVSVMSRLTLSSASFNPRRKSRIPPSSATNDTKPKNSYSHSSIAGDLTLTDKSTAAAMFCQNESTLQVEGLEQSQERLENEAIGWLYSNDSLDGYDMDSPEKATVTGTATFAKFPTTLVLFTRSTESPGVQTTPTTHGGLSTFIPLSASTENLRDEYQLQEHPISMTQDIPSEDATAKDIPNCPGALTSTKPPSRFSPSNDNRIYIAYKDITDADVYCGREERGTSHPGNVIYRDIVAEKRPIYQAFHSKERRKKTDMSTFILEEKIKGRFVVKDTKNELYYLLTKAEARKKVSQSLREK